MDGLSGMNPNREWEDVLAALEEDIRRTERSMREPVRVSDAVLSHQLAPSEMQLPGEAAAALVMAMPSMPPVESMPPVSPQIETRIRELRTRIVALQLQLRDELAALRATHVDPRTRLAASITPVAAPHFIDSRV